ncbi:unnamed protein product [Blepharisma stoltei]|uniref:Uncharacterized protein n=1 Tax=Blepharisma stoltei TaxID=1481888 RepID=A0AAU9JG99_9CILI|nr:unnamed protein product [Blepharisma stoltei]
MISLNSTEIVSDLKAIVSTPQYYKHIGTTHGLIKQLFPVRSHQSFSDSKFAKMPIEEDIETKLKKIEDYRISLQNKRPLSQTSSFLAISREKRERIQKMNCSIAPPPTQYNPQYDSIKPRLINTSQYKKRAYCGKKRKISLPDCIDEYDLECKYPMRISLSGISKQMTVDEYSTLLNESVIKQIKPLPDLPQGHVSCVSFSKQAKRKGLPLNHLNESRLQLNPKIVNHGKKQKAPSFDKYTRRNELFVKIEKSPLCLNEKFLTRQLSLKCMFRLSNKLKKDDD